MNMLTYVTDCVIGHALSALRNPTVNKVSLELRDIVHPKLGSRGAEEQLKIANH
jgi:hypothetical protein